MENLTVLIPAKQEPDSLPIVINETKNLKCKVKVILSIDDIKTINAIKNMEVEIIYQKKNGYGDALITGINTLDTEYFVICNADGSTNPGEIPKMFHKLNNASADFVFGSRYQENSGSDDDDFITYVGNKIFTFLGKIFFKLSLTDILYTYVLGKSYEIRKLQLKEKDFAFCVELPIKAKKFNLKMISSSSYERKRMGGIKKVSAFKDGFIILKKMIKLFFQK